MTVGDLAHGETHGPNFDALARGISSAMGENFQAQRMFEHKDRIGEGRALTNFASAVRRVKEERGLSSRANPESRPAVDSIDEVIEQ